MKENVLDVLMYLFDHCAENEELYHSDQETLMSELETAGFVSSDIDRAFNWLEGIHDMELPELQLNKSIEPSFRVFAPAEQERITSECHGFLLTLEQQGVVDTETREVIIDRAMALDIPEVRLEQFKWITLMVLINRGHENSIEWLEEVVFDDGDAVLH